MASKIIGLNPLDVYTTQNAYDRQFGKAGIDEINILGEDLSDVTPKEFKQSALAMGFFKIKLPQFLYAYLTDQLTLTPKVIKDKCTGCKECIEICPGNAMFPDNEFVWVDSKKCIHCMCCHEVCRDYALKLKQRPIGWVMRALNHILKKLKIPFF